MQYVLSAKELTDFAKEVANAVESEESDYEARERVMREVLQERGIAWCDDE